MDKAIIVGRATAQSGNQNKKAVKWQEECAAISRQKAKERWWGSFRRRMVISTALMVSLHAVAGGWWLWQSGEIEQAVMAAGLWAEDQTKHAGFELRQVKVDGLKRLPPAMVMDALGAKLGDATLFLSVETMADLLSEKLPEVRSVSVERHLPDAIYIKLEERAPYALWQHDGQYRLIDKDGTVLASQQREAGVNYLLVTGADAPQHVEQLLLLLNAEPDLKTKVKAARRIGERRWDVMLHNGLLVKLPQSHPEMAWQQFAALTRNKQLLDKAIDIVDMRIEDRLFILVQKDAGNPDAIPVMQRQL